MSTMTNRDAAAPTNTTAQRTQQPANGSRLQPTQDVVNYIREYARQKPDVAALWCFGIGIVVGWKIKPW